MESLKLPILSILPKTDSHSIQSTSDYNNQLSVTARALNNIFPTSSQESSVARTKKLLGNCMGSMPNEQLELINTQFQYLVDSWLDEFEQSIFNGSTLKEIVNNT